MTLPEDKVAIGRCLPCPLVFLVFTNVSEWFIFQEICFKKVWKPNIGPFRTPLCFGVFPVRLVFLFVQVQDGTATIYGAAPSSFMSGSHFRYAWSSSEELLPVCPLISTQPEPGTLCPQLGSKYLSISSPFSYRWMINRSPQGASPQRSCLSIWSSTS